MTALDDAMNGRLSQILQMGSNANSYAAQGAQVRQQQNVQAQQLALQKQMAAAQAKMQAQQQAALKAQQDQYHKQYQSLISQLGSQNGSYTSTPQSKGGSGSPAYSVPKGGKGNTFANFLSAISGQESGGNYGAVNRSSGALGKYQIMPGNIPSWSRAALGHSISTSEFLHNPAEQEKIAQYELRNYYNKYGPGGAAVAWYAGEGTAQKYVHSNGSGFNAPQGGYPSINQYALSVLKRMGLR